MKKFQFSLQVLLDVRNREEKNAKNDLSIKKMELSELESQLEQVKKEKELYENKLRQSAQNSISVDQYQAYYIYLDKLEDRITDLKSLIQNVENQCEKLLEKLVEIRKMIKMLETLKEQKYREYLKESEKEEIKLMDDFINSREIQKLIPRR